MLDTISFGFIIKNKQLTNCFIFNQDKQTFTIIKKTPHLIQPI